MRLQRILAIFVTYRIAMVSLLLLNLIHALVHGTPLDSGSWDNMVENIDAWLMSQMVA